MEDLISNLTLAKYLEDDGQWKYFLHSITYLQDTSYVTDGHSPDFVEVSENAHQINIFVKRADQISLDLRTPVVHTLSLEALAWEEVGSNEIHVQIIENSTVIGNNIINQEAADEIKKPFPGTL